MKGKPSMSASQVREKTKSSAKGRGAATASKALKDVSRAGSVGAKVGRLAGGPIGGAVGRVAGTAMGMSKATKGRRK
jgi:hypothetical protein